MGLCVLMNCILCSSTLLRIWFSVDSQQAETEVQGFLFNILEIGSSLSFISCAAIFFPFRRKRQRSTNVLTTLDNSILSLLACGSFSTALVLQSCRGCQWFSAVACLDPACLRLCGKMWSDTAPGAAEGIAPLQHPSV